MANISVLIPALNEQQYLNRTIDNFFRTASGDIEVIVVLNGYEQQVDERAVVIRNGDNLGERIAMNAAARIARGEYLFRIDGHCDISPEGWDLMMAEAMKPKSITVAVLTALDKNWNKLPGHWYGFCSLLPTMEEKWKAPNAKREYPPICPNMAFTGCGFMISKDFYFSFGGADETLPKMGAIGPEFALHAWLEGEGVYTRTDVTIGHIFDTGGFDTGRVVEARKKLQEKYGHRYQEIVDKFPDWEIDLRKANMDKPKRTVTVNRDEVSDTKDAEGNVVMRKVVHYRYVWLDDGSGKTEEQIREEFAPLARKIGEELYYPNHEGKLVKVS